jgi:hypothetical protein
MWAPRATTASSSVLTLSVRPMRPASAYHTAQNIVQSEHSNLRLIAPKIYD